MSFRVTTIGVLATMLLVGCDGESTSENGYETKGDEQHITYALSYYDALNSNCSDSCGVVAEDSSGNHYKLSVADTAARGGNNYAYLEHKYHDIELVPYLGSSSNKDYANYVRLDSEQLGYIYPTLDQSKPVLCISFTTRDGFIRITGLYPGSFEMSHCKWQSDAPNLLSRVSY
ncbi:hypothetical protein VFDL14_23405 [Vibrio fortis]|uniref:Lipoprotein n=1 Tax=Vibrio fortis TaxID=212667 RepID=A0A066UW94_9VIBR|nr:hypothetical protein [Vibrio fortis]KDN28488.1 hypothetical protein VFDL14_23405 [Vibrio fortis]